MRFFLQYGPVVIAHFFALMPGSSQHTWQENPSWPGRFPY